MPKRSTIRRLERKFLKRQPEFRKLLSPQGPYHLLVLAEREYIRDNRVWIAAGSGRHVGNLYRQTRDWGISLEAVVHCSIGLQELRWIERVARAARADGQWCRISDAIRLTLDAYGCSNCDPDDDEAYEEHRIRAEEARQKILKLAGA